MVKRSGLLKAGFLRSAPISNWVIQPVPTNNNKVEIKIKSMFKIKCSFKMPRELITEIPAGTKKSPILPTNKSATFSTDLRQ